MKLHRNNAFASKKTPQQRSKRLCFGSLANQSWFLDLSRDYIYKTYFLVSPCLTMSPQEELVESEQLYEIYGCFLENFGASPTIHRLQQVKMFHRRMERRFCCLWNAHKEKRRYFLVRSLRKKKAFRLANGAFPEGYHIPSNPKESQWFCLFQRRKMGRFWQ